MNIIAITILDLLFILLILYLVTQIFLPAAFPRQFKYNWFFKKIKADKVEKLVNESERINSEAASLMTQTEEEIKEAEIQKELLKNINNKN